MQPWRHALSTLSFFALLSLAEPGLAQTLFVDADATGANNGSSWCNGYVDLQDALAGARASGGSVGEIRVAAGVHVPDRGSSQVAGDRSATFRLVNGVALRGGYAGCGEPDPDARNFTTDETTLSGDLLGNDGPVFSNYGDNSYHIVTYDDPIATGVVLDGFTVSGGNADGTGPGVTNQGAGIHIRQGTVKCIPGGPTIRNCTIRDNWSAHHGAVNDHGQATVIQDCTFRDNFAGLLGGAGLLIHSGPTQVTGCTFINNTTDGDGAGVWTGHDDDPSCAAPSEPTFTNCQFLNNTAQINGGGLFNDTGTSVTITACQFDGNQANGSFGGGGIFNNSVSAASIVSCDFSDNVASRGAGLWNHRDTVVSVDNCTFADNTVTGLGIGQGYGAGAVNYVRSIAVYTDCVFAGNIAQPSLETQRAYGAALMNHGDSNVTLIRCDFVNNAGADFGGAIWNLDTSADFISCRFVGNTSGLKGGAVYNETSQGRSSFTNCLFVGNGSDVGGAIFDIGAAPFTLINNTFAFNTATSNGGALFLRTSTRDPQVIAVMSNSILWGNADGSGSDESAQVFVEESGPININHSCVQGLTGSLGGVGNIGDDPAFVDQLGADGVAGTLDDDLRLAMGSACISVGANNALPTDLADLDSDGSTSERIPFDLAGAPRILEGTVDMGAYENVGCGFYRVYGDVNDSGHVDFVDISLVVSVFQGQSASITMQDADVFPCGGDGTVDFQDISATVGAFEGSPLCPDVCQ